MGRFADILKGSAEKTNAELASEISSLTVFKDKQIENLFPTRADKEHLLRLLEIVNAATDENKKMTQLKSKIDDMAGTVIRLLKVFI